MNCTTAKIWLPENFRAKWNESSRGGVGAEVRAPFDSHKKHQIVLNKTFLLLSIHNSLYGGNLRKVFSTRPSKMSLPSHTQPSPSSSALIVIVDIIVVVSEENFFKLFACTISPEKKGEKPARWGKSYCHIKNLWTHFCSWMLVIYSWAKTNTNFLQREIKKYIEISSSFSLAGFGCTLRKNISNIKWKANIYGGERETLSWVYRVCIFHHQQQRRTITMDILALSWFGW